MARGFSSALEASVDLVEATAPDLERPRMLVLGTSKNGFYRAAIAERGECPFGLMVTLAHDYSAEVRCAVAGNPRAQRSVFQYLAADRAVPVALALIGNPSLRQDLVEEFAFHKKSQVRAAAASRLDTGVPGTKEVHAEDEHIPELAEHRRMALDLDWSLGSDVWSRSAEDVVARPVEDPEPIQTIVEAVAEQVTASPGVASPVTELFSQSRDDGSVVATRTAFARGFRAPEL